MSDPGHQATPRLHVGTYDRGGGAGLYPVDYSAATGWSVGEPCVEARNASFGACSARHGLHYFVDEHAEGALGVFRTSPTGWEQLARVPTHGAQPCYVALNGDENMLAVANYGSGCVALFRLDDATGLPVNSPVVRTNAGGGPVADRQEAPHAHCVTFNRNQRWLYHVDLGTDEILAYPLNSADDAPRLAYQAPAGSGPRHLAFHPILPFAILVSELASTLTVLQVEEGRFYARQTISTLPEHSHSDSLGGHLSLNAAGDRAYVTNRGHDSIAVFAWSDIGVLRLLQHVSSGGASPRAFVLLEAERQLVLANEEAGNVTGFDLQPDGTLSPWSAALPLPGAAFVMIVPG